MKKVSIILLFVCSGIFAKAQFVDTLQNIINRKGSFSFSFTSRSSFIKNKAANIFGYSVGVTLGKKLSIGGGFNALNSVINRDITINGTSVTENLSFAYFSYYVQYIMNLTKHWKLYVMPFSLGLGGSSYNYIYKSLPYVTDSRVIIPYEPQVELDYNFNKWLGLYTQVGYRLLLINNPVINEDLNSPTYSYGVIFSPFEFYAIVFPRTKLAHMIEDD